MTDWPRGDSELAVRVRAFDWGSTTLGPIATWSPRLRGLVDLVFDSRQAMFLAVGPDLVMIYNDAYVTFLPGMHPAALGSPFRVVFSEISEAMEPMLERTLAGTQEIMIDRHFAVPWRPEAPDSWYTATWTAFRNEHGHIDGFIASILETTERITAQHALRESEDRQAFLLTLGDAMRVETSATAKIEVAARLLGERLGASRVLYAEYDWHEGLAHIFNGWFADGAQPFPAVMQLEGYEGQVLGDLRAGRTVRVDHVGLLTDEPAFAAIAELGVQALLSPPLIIDGKLAMNLSIHQHDARQWTDGEVALVRDVADRLWPEVVSARAEAALRESEERKAFLLNLSDALRPLADPTAIKDAAARLLGERLDVDRAFYADADRGAWHVAAVYETDIEPLRHTGFAMADYGYWIIDDFHADRALVVDDMASDARFAAAERQANQALGIAAVVAVPLVKDGELVAMLTVQNSRARAWSTTELALVGDSAERTWAAVERARAEVARRESEERLQQFGEASQDVLWIREAKALRWTYLTPAFETIYGLTRKAALSGDNFRNWTDLIVPEDRDRAAAAIDRVRKGEKVTFEYRILRPNDGAICWLRNTDFPIRDASGEVAFIGGIGHDITRVREMADRQEVMVAELQHRTRNLITVVRALSKQTLGGAVSLSDFEQRYNQRLAALSRVQGLLSHLSAGKRVSFDELLGSELSALGAPDDKLTLDGPAGVPLRSATVQTFALALHELATNALKYGALAAARGHLTVRWSVRPSAGGERWLNVDWRESGVDMTQVADRATGGGYGRELIERALPYQLDADTSYEMTEDGVHCTVDVPIPTAQADADWQLERNAT